MHVNLARTLSRSSANGPGERFVLWTQGCTLACPGCWNPDTWPFVRRELREVAALADEILAVEGIEGVTFTGGEPFAQARALAAIAERVRRKGLSVVVFTGYDLAELTSHDAQRLLAQVDLLVAGRYRQEERLDGSLLLGSSNQCLHFLSTRYSPVDLQTLPGVELFIGNDGAIVATGFPDTELLAFTTTV